MERETKREKIYIFAWEVVQEECETKREKMDFRLEGYIRNETT